MSHLGDALSGLLDGEVDEEERRRIADHLAGCEVCRAELDEVAEARSAVRGLPSLDPGPILTGRPSRSGRMDRIVATVAAVVAIVLGVGVAGALSAPEPIPASDLSVLFAAYSSEGPRVASYVPVTAPGSGIRQDEGSLRLPEELAGVPRQDVRRWGDDGTVAFYRWGDSSFVVLDTRRPIETEDVVGVSITTREGDAYLGSWGERSIMYIWEVKGGWMALLGQVRPELVDDVLADLPRPAEPGTLARWWREIVT